MKRRFNRGNEREFAHSVTAFVKFLNENLYALGGPARSDVAIRNESKAKVLVAAYHFMHDLADRLANRVQLARTATKPI